MPKTQPTPSEEYVPGSVLWRLRRLAPVVVHTCPASGVVDLTTLGAMSVEWRGEQWAESSKH